MKNRFPSSIEEAFLQAIKKRVFPGAVLGLWKEGKIAIQAFGWKTLEPEREKNSPTTFYDLASLTKPLATTLCIMRLVYEGKVALNQRLSDFWEVPSSWKEIRVFHLLSHSAGLPAYKPYFKKLISFPFHQRSSYLKKLIFQENLLYPPGKQQIYSDLGFFCLGEIIKQIGQKTLEKFFAETLSLISLSPKEILFCPLKHGLSSSLIAPTEYCPWRKKILKGEVHDENTWVLGGVTGQAGLFASAKGILLLLEKLILAFWGWEETGFLQKDLIKEFWNWKSSVGTWALGFDRPQKDSSQAGNLLSRNSLGHLGFTGTSFWIDWEHHLIIVLLTNRVHPSRENKKIKKFRPQIHDLLVEKFI